MPAANAPIETTAPNVNRHAKRAALRSVRLMMFMTFTLWNRLAHSGTRTRPVPVPPRRDMADAAAACVADPGSRSLRRASPWQQRERADPKCRRTIDRARGGVVSAAATFARDIRTDSPGVRQDRSTARLARPVPSRADSRARCARAWLTPLTALRDSHAVSKSALELRAVPRAILRQPRVPPYSKPLPKTVSRPGAPWNTMLPESGGLTLP